MKNPIRSLTPRTRFILSQVAVFGLVLAMPLFVSEETYLPWSSGPGLLGCALGLIGLVRCARNGQSLLQLLVASVLGLCVVGLAWTFGVMMFGGFLMALEDKWDMRNYVGIHFAQLPVFTTGTLAYFGLFPFRSRVSAGQRARQLIAGNRDLRLGGPAALALVERAEQLLGLRLPGSYRDFLLDYGEIRAPWIHVLGLGPATDLDRPTPDDVVGATRAAWGQHGLPRGYFVCAVGADGNLACVDTVAPRNGEGQVVRWDVASRTMAGLAANNFSEYLVQSIAARGVRGPS
jgi:hypothetical protein